MIHLSKQTICIQDAHRALQLLEEYCARLTSPSDKQLRIAIERVIYIFKSSLFQALLDIQEFYEAILLDEHKDAGSKTLAVLRIADKWLENAPLPASASTSTDATSGVGDMPNNNNTNNNISNHDTAPNAATVAAADGDASLPRKSPSFLSQKSENMSIEDVVNPTSPNALPHSYTVRVPVYDDHWTLEKIVLDRVSGRDD